MSHQKGNTLFIHESYSYIRARERVHVFGSRWGGGRGRVKIGKGGIGRVFNGV